MLMHTLRRWLPSVFLAGITLLLAASSHDTVATPDSHTGRPQQTVLHPDQTPGDVVRNDAGEQYLSPVTEADEPFSHLLLRWEAVVPLSDTMHLEVRVSDNGQHWTDWGAVIEDVDLWMPEDGDTVFWSQSIYAGEQARFWQVRALMQPAPDGRMPLLSRIDVNTVHAGFAPPAAEPARAGIAAVGKPPVVSRTAWGSPDGQHSRVRPVYYPVNHMVVHHTADPNTLGRTERDWSARVRAIWSFHTYTRGWGDIGYNYLVDPNGVIYEGRAGGDDVVGFHDSANYGSMGVAMIGTFSHVEPTPPAQAGLVNLLAWKAAQKDIDPLGRSYYYGCDRASTCPVNGGIVENISGHRDTRIGTTCPGERLHALLPQIRNRVLNRMNGQDGGSPLRPDNGDLVLDELESSVERSEANWYSAACGYGGHTFFSYATANPAESRNHATWQATIPTSGRYRVYAHIPQGCGLGSPPYASRQANYRLITADGEFNRSVDHNTADDWVDLGSYRFEAGMPAQVMLNDLTGEPFGERRVLFFDTVKWVPDSESAVLDLLNVQFDRDRVSAGELLKVTFTVRNGGDTTIYGQDPRAGTLPDGSFDPHNGYAYDEGECFYGQTGWNYPAFAKETGRFRVMLGPVNREVACDGEHGGYPWRWGLNGELAPGEVRDIIGYVRFREPGQVQLQAGIIQEYVRYQTQGAAMTTINVELERGAPLPAIYDELLRPLAHVYRLGHVPDNLLARTRNPLSIAYGTYVGSFPWDGSLVDWGGDGPLGLNDAFIVEQTRDFVVPLAGEYTFSVTSDDGAWLWINGQEVIANHGLHQAQTASANVWLEAGRHSLAFKYFERSGEAVAGYAMRAPGADEFRAPVGGPIGLDGNRSSRHSGGIFREANELTLVVDDLGGSGAAFIHYSWDGSVWQEAQGSRLTLPIDTGAGLAAPGRYRLYYRAIDNAGNATQVYELVFEINPNMELFEHYLPLVRQGGS
jgi:hypothetical protein